MYIYIYNRERERERERYELPDLQMCHMHQICMVHGSRYYSKLDLQAFIFPSPIANQIFLEAFNLWVRCRRRFFFPREKKAPEATCPQVKGFQKYGGHFSDENEPLRQRSQSLGASRNSRDHFAGIFFEFCEQR